jgi:quercetin dioxygenase-like cupin family protein
LGALPQGPIFWHLDTFPTRAAADAAKGPRGTVVESFGKVWLLSIDVAGWRPSGGTHVAAIGPLPVDAEAKYSAQFMEAVFTPGMTAPAHRHSGPEAWYTLTGETCLETPDGRMIGRAGGSQVIVPGGPPMHLTATGTETRRALVLILHDSTKSPTTPAPDWTPIGLCRGPAGYREFFDHVERAAQFPRFSSESPSPAVDIRILNWTPTAMIPMSALRLVESSSGIRAQLMVVWHADVSPNIREPGVDARCDPDNPRDSCVEVFEPPVLKPPGNEDWAGIVGQLQVIEACDAPEVEVADSPGQIAGMHATFVFVSDAGDFVMRASDSSGSREYFCNAPRIRQNPAGRLTAALLDYLDESLRLAIGR